MISAAVLGIALVGLVQMHTTSIQRTVESEKVGRATEIARQIADRMASQPLTQLPPCGNTTAPLDLSNPQGCRATIGPSRTDAAQKSGVCTQFFTEDGLADANSGIETPAALVDEPQSFRVDVQLSSHPNGGNAAALLHVWVCWREPDGMYNEIYTSRAKIAGVW